METNETTFTGFVLAAVCKARSFFGVPFTVYHPEPAGKNHPLDPHIPQKTANNIKKHQPINVAPGGGGGKA